MHIRGIDPDLYRKAKAQAALEKKNLGTWFNNAIDLKLNFEEIASQRAKVQEDAGIADNMRSYWANLNAGSEK